ncbi:MAG: secondary thiamine-phosphate synthase enzyme YjbQ [Treponema sp.]|jgi:secondary thiamine-phosphate synthase enzyme|nr:secondary thiamine-phosphate synthase enzyme YjbQ [Treponema sp.]
MILKQYSINTSAEGFYAITEQVQSALVESGIQDGLCVVFCPHTTAAITINENADPDVVHDMLLGLSKVFPDRPEFRHAEGNSSAHLKSSAMGSSVTVIVSKGRLVLGTWQGIYFCEFDGPRTRKFFVRVSP